jgi:hypothetical protein
MREILSIAPALDEPGLIAFECSKCSYLVSELMSAQQPDADADR